MCGIFFTNDEKIKKSDFQQAFNLMKHRGPDYSKIAEYKNFKLGHHRLSIVDLNSRSNQPMEISDHIIIFNGEIYNYRDLIISEKLNVQTTSDTEVILLLFLKYGHKCLKLLNGMFSFIIFNKKNHKFFVARDRLGIKPLYIWQRGKSIILSSEIMPILKLKGSDFDEIGLRLYKKLRMTVKGHTIYKNISFFPAGSFMENFKLKKYWKLDVSNKPNPSDDHLKFLIESSIKKRMIADVNVGSFLSGGLDSTIVSSIAKPNYLWTAGFQNSNEFNWAELANKKIKSKLFKLKLDKNEFLSITKKLIRKRMEPLCVPNEVLVYLMSKKMKKYNTVVLSGQGADELFWGYDRIFKWANNIKEIKLNEFDNVYCYGKQKDDEIIDYAISNLPGKKPINKINYFMQIHHLHGLLRRLDNSTMVASIEARVPFVDHRLIELVTGTSYNWKMKNMIKEPLKRLFKNTINKSILERPKIGFVTPLNKIFNSDDPYSKWFDYNINYLSKCIKKI